MASSSQNRSHSGEHKSRENKDVSSSTSGASTAAPASSVFFPSGSGTHDDDDKKAIYDFNNILILCKKTPPPSEAEKQQLTRVNRILMSSPVTIGFDNQESKSGLPRVLGLINDLGRTITPEEYGLIIWAANYCKSSILANKPDTEADNAEVAIPVKVIHKFLQVVNERYYHSCISGLANYHAGPEKTLAPAKKS